MEDAAHKATLLFRIVEDLKLPCGYERSFKMSHEKILANRFMIGVNTEELSSEAWLRICAQMDMPKAYRQTFADHLPDANLVFLGFEDNQPGCNYKIYLEFWEKCQREIVSNICEREPALLHLGFKWSTEDRTRHTIARYTYFPFLGEKEIFDRIDAIYEKQNAPVSQNVAMQIINFAVKRCTATSIMYMQVDELKSSRHSFDINLYKANFRLSDIWDLLLGLQNEYRIPLAKFDRLRQLTSDKFFGHLSGGIDRMGREFMTIYYET